MKILGFIEKDNYWISDENDVVYRDNDVAGTLTFSQDKNLLNSVKMTTELIKDACFQTKAQFKSKYESKLLEGAKMSPEQIYKAIRTVIVDDKVPLHKTRTLEKSVAKPQPSQDVEKVVEKKHKEVKKPKPAKTVVVAEPKKEKAKIGSRKDQVRELLKNGTDDPKKIAEMLGTHPSYVWRLIKEING